MNCMCVARNSWRCPRAHARCEDRRLLMVAVMAADPLHHVGGLLAGWLANQPARTARQPACPPCIVPAVKRAGTSYT